jgi:asparagine synthase (glutamine-hydrolysing)
VHLEKFFEVVSYYVREKSLYSFEEAVSQLKGVLQDTARHHMRADVPVGLFLSGGIDSTSLLVSLREQGFKNLHTVSAVFPGTVYDESSRIHSLVKQFETDHDDVPVSGQDFVIFLDRILEHMDQPSSDGVNTFFVSLAAKQAGLKVVLSGLGGDELFGGYPSFYDLPKIMALKGLLAGLGAAGGLWLAKQYGPLSGKIEKLEQIHQASSLRHAWRAYRSLFSASQISLLMPDCKPTADEIEADTAPGKSIRSAISYYELTDYMRNQLLRDSDVFSMAHSIELRVPFVDDFMAKFSIALPDAYKTSPSSHKRILREAIRPMVPRLILSAPKQGFVLPIEKWMKSEAKSIIQDELLETRIYNGQSAARLWNLFLADKVHWSRIWSLFVLNRFLKSL